MPNRFLPFGRCQRSPKRTSHGCQVRTRPMDVSKLLCTDARIRFGVPVCPHAGGVGLCEYVIHLRYGSLPLLRRRGHILISFPSLIDYIAVSGTMERNVLEFVDHLHEHFRYPCSISSKGRYNVPLNPAEGYRCDFLFSGVSLV